MDLIGGTVMVQVNYEKSFQMIKKQLESVLDASGEAITMANKHHNVVYFNKKAEILYGIKKNDIEGNDLKLFFNDLVLLRVLNTGESIKEHYHQPAPGKFVLINSIPIWLGDELIGAVSVERDITEMVNLNLDLYRARSHINELKEQIHNNNQGSNEPFHDIYGYSPSLKGVIDMAKKASETNAPVIISGESGTGKELFAQAIHNSSFRRNGPFVVINCSSIPYHLFESEFFGYEEGAFTGAKRGGKIGTFELADGGTLVLDELGELDLSLQAKLLRTIQNNVFYRVGGKKPIQVDVRILAATNKNLDQLVKEGRFREDLYYRLNVVNLEVPPLRHRKGDIPELVHLFLKELSMQHGKEVFEVTSEVINTLLQYNWPGNVRELRNIIERLVVLSEERIITKDLLPKNLFQAQKSDEISTNQLLGSLTKDVERKKILETLKEVSGNKTKAAKALGIPRSTLYYKINNLNITPAEWINSSKIKYYE